MCIFCTRSHIYALPVCRFFCVWQKNANYFFFFVIECNHFKFIEYPMLLVGWIFFLSFHSRHLFMRTVYLDKKNSFSRSVSNVTWWHFEKLILNVFLSFSFFFVVYGHERKKKWIWIFNERHNGTRRNRAMSRIVPFELLGRIEFPIQLKVVSTPYIYIMHTQRAKIFKTVVNRS